MISGTVHRAFAWREGGKDKDLADLNTLLEIRADQPEVPWRLDESNLIGFRKDTVWTLHSLKNVLASRYTTLWTKFAVLP